MRMADKEMAEVASNHAPHTGWLDALRERGKYAMERIHESRGILLDIVLYGGVGFLCGFLLRKYANYVAFLVLVIVALAAMHQYNVINIVINWTYINDLFGFQHAPTMNGESFVAFWEWCKANVVIVVSWIIGLLVGLRVG
jgi:uncharacterized membrane protein (Fun14 family)